MAPSAGTITLSTDQTGQVQITVSASKGAHSGDLTGFVIIADGSGQPLVVPFWVRF